ncbi:MULTISPECIES: hypothetical protein [unclassified Mycolicibacterium]|uniref:hypothetical protein n=1 Tax=unclassified Mycolicibacterium TaxID=2636767 RepID=UPI0013909280|nr:MULTISPECIES: hypothetical protein [unclassified Mycolicibacterium]
MTAAAYDLTGSPVTIQVIQVPNFGSGTTQLSFRLGHQTDGEGDGFSIIWSGGYLLFSEWVSGVNDNTSVAFSPTAHAWWRIRKAGGTIYWDTSPDGTTWTNRRSKTRTVSGIEDLYFGIRSGYYGTEASAGNTIVDNLNPTPAIGASLPWAQPAYFVTGTGTHTVDMSTQFDGAALTYSLRGTPPAAATINPSTGLRSVNTAAFAWTTLTVRATNSSGYAKTTIDLWVFTPNKTVAANASWTRSRHVSVLPELPTGRHRRQMAMNVVLKLPKTQECIRSRVHLAGSHHRGQLAPPPRKPCAARRHLRGRNFPDFRRERALAW